VLRAIALRDCFLGKLLYKCLAPEEGTLLRKLLDAKGQGPQVAEWERELNALVYQLYELTEEEIAIVEGV
jgi:hypothetical protein